MNEELVKFPIALHDLEPLVIDSDGNTVFSWSFASSDSDAERFKKIAELVVELANGNMIFDKGRLLKRKGSIFQGDELVVRYGDQNGGNAKKTAFSGEEFEIYETGQKESLVEKVVNVVKRGRGRPKGSKNK